MITPADLSNIAAARLRDVEVLRLAGRFDAALYLCGYVLEAQLKAAICGALGWSGFPETARDFDQLRSFKTHNLSILLHLSGRERLVLEQPLDDWKEVLAWNTEIRYTPPGRYTDGDVGRMLRATGAIRRVL